MTDNVSSQLKKFVEALMAATEKYKQNELNPESSLSFRFYEPLDVDRGSHEDDLNAAISTGCMKAAIQDEQASHRMVVGLDIISIHKLIDRALALGYAIGNTPQHEAAEIAESDMQGFQDTFCFGDAMTAWENCHLRPMAGALISTFVYANLSSLQLAGEDFSAFRKGVVSILAQLGASPTSAQFSPETTAPDGALH